MSNRSITLMISYRSIGLKRFILSDESAAILSGQAS